MDRAQFIGELLEAATRNGVYIGDQAANGLFVYFRELHLWSKRINLIGRAEWDRFIERHLVDSLCALKLGIGKGSELLDIGSGNGLPAIPIAIACPEARIELLESREKRCAFLRHVAATLSLSNAQIRCGRFEDVCEDLGKFQYILVRGVKVSRGMAVMIQRLLDEKGALVLYRGSSPSVPVGTEQPFTVIKGVEGRKLILIEDVEAYFKQL